MCVHVYNHISGDFIKSISIKKIDNSAPTVLYCEHNHDIVRQFTLGELNVDPYLESLPLLETKRFKFNNYILALDCSRGHSDIGGTMITDTDLEIDFTFSVCYYIYFILYQYVNHLKHSPLSFI